MRGAHPVTLRRLIRQGWLRALRAPAGARRQWLVSTRSLRDFLSQEPKIPALGILGHPVTGFALEQNGPKLFWKRARWGDG